MKHEALRRYVGDRILTARQKAGHGGTYVSAGALAKAAGLKPSTITFYERGAGDIPLYRLAAIAQALHKPLSFFLPPDGFGRTLEQRVHGLTIAQQEVIERLLEVFEVANARK